MNIPSLSEAPILLFPHPSPFLPLSLVLKNKPLILELLFFSFQLVSSCLVFLVFLCFMWRPYTKILSNSRIEISDRFWTNSHLQAQKDVFAMTFTLEHNNVATLHHPFNFRNRAWSCSRFHLVKREKYSPGLLSQTLGFCKNL